MKRQIQKSKADDFMRLMNEGQVFQSSELRLEQGPEEDSFKGKKRSNLICFLHKIKEPTLQLMQKYLIQNKNQPHPIKNKITLYQDITIIYEFRKYLQKIQLDSSKITQALCTRLQDKIKRAKVTIKDRIKKKLCHLNQHDIIYSIRNKKDFVFDSKSKKPIPLEQQEKDQAPLPTNIQEKIKRESIFSNLSSQQKQKEVQQTPVQSKNHQVRKGINKNMRNKVYKYGSKDITQPIYIHAKANPRSIQVIKYSAVKEVRNKHLFQQEDTKQIQEHSTPINQKNDLLKTALTFSQDFEKFLQSQSWKKMNKRQFLDYLSSTKDKAKQILQNIEKKEEQTYKKLQKHLQDIQTIQKRFQASDEQANENDESKIDEGDHTEVKQQDTVEANEAKQAMDIIQSQRQQRKLLFSVSNSIQAMRLLGQDKRLQSNLLWSAQEDELLYQYTFENEAFRTQIKCLLRYKPLATVVQRIKFLSAPNKPQTIEHLHSLYNLNEE